MIEVLARPLLRNRTLPSLALLIAVTMTGTMAMHIFVPAMPAAAADLGASPSLIQSTITLYIIGLAAGQLIYGPLSDRFGRRPVLLFSLAVYVLGLVLAIPVASVGALIGARVLQSLGACGALVPRSRYGPRQQQRRRCGAPPRGGDDRNDHDAGNRPGNRRRDQRMARLACHFRLSRDHCC
jgi:MFS family permease